MAEMVEEFSYNYEEDGKLVRREVKKEILTKGAWATVMFLFQELDRQTETWNAPKVAIVRFKKSSGAYRKQSSFNISSEKQARQIIDVIERWYGEERLVPAEGEGDAKASSAHAAGEPPSEETPEAEG